MSTLFLSHSADDAEATAELFSWLEQLGYKVFLDQSPESGIAAGSGWEQRIYKALERCQAVVLLCSDASMASRWCFAEISHARALGKTIFPLKLTECEVWQELLDVQCVDLTVDREQGLERVASALEQVIGDNWRRAWQANGERPAYPGLLAFEREDAPVFFGRKEEIQRGLELLNRLRRLPGTRLAVVVGASSAGKSSLMRAGLLPRLERDARNWLVVRPFRPRRQPFVQLALSLAQAFDACNVPRGHEEIQAALEAAAGREKAEGSVLSGMANELIAARSAASKNNAETGAAAVLLAIDQLEEMLGSARSEECEPFLRLLRAALEEDGRLLAVATLRSDYLGSFQQDAAMGGIKFRGLPLGAMSAASFREVIEGPARIDELELDPRLVEALLEDTGTAEALPLLAFALGELYQMSREAGGERTLRLSDYTQRLGGLARAVGRAADGVLADPRLSAAEEEELRRALVSLVEIDTEGHYRRRPARWLDLPETVHPVLERFVAARLLTSSGDDETRILELRHEALYRNWQKMIRWLDEDREFLLWRKRASVYLTVWQESDRSTANLLRDAVLTEAASWQRRRPQEDLKEFIDASSRAARQTRNRRLGLAAVVVAVVAILVSMILSANLQTAQTREAWAAAERARRSAELAEDEAVALAQQARIKEQRAERLLTLACRGREVEECRSELEAQSN